MEVASKMEAVLCDYFLEIFCRIRLAGKQTDLALSVHYHLVLYKPHHFPNQGQTVDPEGGLMAIFLQGVWPDISFTSSC